MFSLSKDISANSLIISMDDKAHLKPGTDVGAKGARNQVILQPSDVSCSRVLPQHDFSESKLHITPGSFRFMTKKTDEASGSLLRDNDQSVVIIRPKYYVGSSDSVWASDQMKLHHQYPHLYAQWSVPVKKLCATINDYIIFH